MNSKLNAKTWQNKCDTNLWNLWCLENSASNKRYLKLEANSSRTCVILNMKSPTLWNRLAWGNSDWLKTHIIRRQNLKIIKWTERGPSRITLKTRQIKCAANKTYSICKIWISKLSAHLLHILTHVILNDFLNNQYIYYLWVKSHIKPQRWQTYLVFIKEEVRLQFTDYH